MPRFIDYAAEEQKEMAKTYNSGYSLVVTHLTTNTPVRCLNRARRTGSLVVSCPIVINALKSSVYGSCIAIDCTWKQYLGKGGLYYVTRLGYLASTAGALIVGTIRHWTAFPTLAFWLVRPPYK
jgi:hypothetical protein